MGGPQLHAEAVRVAMIGVAAVPPVDPVFIRVPCGGAGRRYFKKVPVVNAAQGELPALPQKAHRRGVGGEHPERSAVRGLMGAQKFISVECVSCVKLL